MNEIKVKPPFPALPVFNVDALILSFFGFSDEVNTLLVLLSHKCLSYYKVHKQILDSFLIAWNPKVSNTIDFGDIEKEYTHTFPNLILL